MPQNDQPCCLSFRSTSRTSSVSIWLLLALGIVAGCSGSSASGGSGTGASGASGAGGGSGNGAAGNSAQGCPKCPCYPNNTCDAESTCVDGTCKPLTCEVATDCSDGDKCEAGSCVSNKCGNGSLEEEEACDDGNNMNGDGCNRRCSPEATDDSLGDGDTVETGTGSNDLPADFSQCEDPDQTIAYTPGEDLTVRVCVVAYRDSYNTGVSVSEINDIMANAQEYYNEASAGIVLQVLQVDAKDNAPAYQTDPAGSAEINTVMKGLRDYVDAAYPGSCDAVIGIVNTVTDNAKSIGGKASVPGDANRAAVIGQSGGINGYKVAHEVGHIFGLLHTHQSPDDGCTDTATDPNCSKISSGCDAVCGAEVPPAKNIMSYYKCYTPSADSLSPQQVRRARCVIDRLFPSSDCPLPQLVDPVENYSGYTNGDLVFSWNPGKSTLPHTLEVKSPTGITKTYSANLSTAKSVPAADLTDQGMYEWTVLYNDACCPSGGCRATARDFNLEPPICAGPSTQSCGNCGTQARTCGADGSWGPWGTCENTGECTAGTSSSCPDGSTRTCSNSCQWNKTCADCNSNTQASYQCVSGDVYWFDICGQQQAVKQDCGTVSSGNNYCSGGNLVHDVTTPGCSANSCTSSVTTEVTQYCQSGCSNNTCITCNSHADFQCLGGDVYYYDSCGTQEDLKQDCGADSTGANYCSGGNVVHDVTTKGCSGSSCTSSVTTEVAQYCQFGCSNNTCTTCTSHTSSQCSGGDVYYFNSCGTQEDLKQDCGADSTGANYCSGGNVVHDVTTKGCSGATCTSSTSTATVQTCQYGCSSGACTSCSASTYWSPSQDSDSDSTADVAGCTTSSGTTINITVRESGTGLQAQVCKSSGTFSSSIYLGMYDAASSKAYYNGTISAAGLNCTAWVDLLGDTSYTNGEWFGGNWYVVSPSTYSGGWSYDCSGCSGASGGNCWHGINLSMQRTCK